MVKPTALTNADRARIAAAVTRAEALTSVEIRLVLARSSDSYEGFSILIPALVALLAGGLETAVRPALTAATVLLLQAGVFAAGLALMRLPWLRRSLTPAAVKHQAAWRHARLHYAQIGLTQPHLRNALLVFCSLAEHYVEVLVDDAVAEKLPNACWEPLIAEFRAAMASGRLADAFVAAADRSAKLLAPAFPPIAGQSSEIPDTLEEI